MPARRGDLRAEAECDCVGNRPHPPRQPGYRPTRGDPGGLRTAVHGVVPRGGGTLSLASGSDLEGRAGSTLAVGGRGPRLRRGRVLPEPGWRNPTGLLRRDEV